MTIRGTHPTASAIGWLIGAVIGRALRWAIATVAVIETARFLGVHL